MEVIVEKLGATAVLVTQHSDSERLVSFLGQDQNHQSRWLGEKVKTMCSCYRKDETINPEMYAAALGSVLSEYPAEVIEFVTDPRTGLPSTQQWLPTIKEVHDACRAYMDRLAGPAHRAAALEKQLAERDEYEAKLRARANNPTQDEIEDRLGRKIPLARPGIVRAP
jgi:hypothetical protein